MYPSLSMGRISTLKATGLSETTMSRIYEFRSTLKKKDTIVTCILCYYNIAILIPLFTVFPRSCTSALM